MLLGRMNITSITMITSAPPASIYTAFAAAESAHARGSDGAKFALKKGFASDDQRHEFQPEAARPKSDKDTVEISKQAKEANEKSSAFPKEYTPEEQEKIKILSNRDKEVRTHERAHQTAGGRFAGAASFTYEVGPDGKRYAIGGEVPIDMSSVDGDLQATIAKMDKVIAAALAPANPSGQDHQVAAAATSKRTKALAALAKEKSQKNTEKPNGSSKANKTPEEEDPFGIYKDSRNGFFGLVAQSAYASGAKLSQQNPDNSSKFI
jgi:hypothetical protein